MNEERLNELAMTKINRSKEISGAEMIQVFNSTSHKCLILLDWLK